MIEGKIEFGTDGWRGLIDSEVNESTVSVAAQAFADYLKSTSAIPAVAVGFDGRRNSQLFADLFAGVLAGNNCKVFLSDKIIPTPVLSFFTYYNNLSAGVMITASHNPPEYNGVKFKGSYGGPFFTEQTHKVESLLGFNKIKRSSGYIERTDFIPPYVQRIKEIVDFKKIFADGINPLIDSMSGAGGRILENILSSEKCSAGTIFEIPQNDFQNRYPEPVEKNLLPLKNAIQKSDYSIGIATDGDADRVGIIDENGNWISAQETIILLADHIVNNKKYEGHLVKTASVTEKLNNLFSNKTRNVIDVQVGFKYICEEMIKNRIAFGAEESGGYGYGLFIPERDGILSSLYILESLAYSRLNKISRLLEEKRKIFGTVFYDRIDSYYHKPDRLDILKEYERKEVEFIGKYKVAGIKSFKNSRSVTNGLKFYFPGNSRWLLLRASETEPLIRVYAEGENNQDVKDLLSEGIKIFERGI